MIELVDFNKKYIDTTYQILKNKEVKDLFLLKKDIDLEANRKYWKTYLKNEYQNLKVFAIIVDNKHIGNCGLKDINDKEAEFWIYLDKDYWGYGYGKKALKKVIDIGFNLFNLKRLYLNVSLDNKRALNMYLNNGFKKEQIINSNNKIIKLVLERG